MRATTVAIPMLTLGLGTACDTGPGATPAGAASPSPPQAASPAIGAATFTPSVRVTTLSGVTPQEEPLLHGGPGAVYLALPHVSALFRSDDGGLSWNPLFDERTGQGQATAGRTDGALAAGNDGSLLWLGLRGGHRVPFQRSTDAGRTWTAPVDLTEDTAPDRQWIAADRAGNLVATWWERNQTVERHSADGGLTWSPLATLHATGYPGGIVAGSRPGEFWVAMTDFPPGSFIIVSVAHTVDGGQTWEVIPAALELGGRVVNFPFIAVDDADNLYVSYTTTVASLDIPSPLGDTELEPRAVLLVRSFDRGASWTPPIRVSAPGTNGVFGWVVAGRPGRIAIAWYEDETGISRMIPSRWHTRFAATDRGLDADPRLQTVDLDPLAHLGILCNECGDFSRLDHLGIAIAPDGQVVVAWLRDNAANPRHLDVMTARTTNVTLR